MKDITSKDFNERDFKQIEKVFKAFCDESRLQILSSLQEGEKCGCTLLEEVPVAQSTLSHHMKILLESGVVESRKEGKWTYYRLSDEGSLQAKGLLEKMLKKKQPYQTYKVCN